MLQLISGLELNITQKLVMSIAKNNFLLSWTFDRISDCPTSRVYPFLFSLSLSDKCELVHTPLLIFSDATDSNIICPGVSLWRNKGSGDKVTFFKYLTCDLALPTWWHLRSEQISAPSHFDSWNLSTGLDSFQLILIFKCGILLSVTVGRHFTLFKRFSHFAWVKSDAKLFYFYF